MAMDVRLESRAFRNGIGGVEMLSGLEDARRAVVQADFHLAGQYEYPLRLGCAVKQTAEANRALSQLIARGRKHRREHRLRGAFGQRDLLLAKFGAAVEIGVENEFGKRCHGAIRQMDA